MTKTAPQGNIAIQTLAMPADTNANGDIFGGWLVSQMDLAGGIVAKQVSKGRIVTVAINSMVFHEPVNVGDVVTCYCDVKKVGKSSMTICIEAWKTAHATGEQRNVTEGVFTYVAIDQNGKPRAVKV